MGTPRQADALMRLMVKTGKSIKNPEQTRAKILASSQDEIQAAFDEANAILGWNKKTATATDAQINYLASLEKQLFGTSLDFRTRGPLTYDEADAKIKAYKRELAERHALQQSTPSASALDSLL